MNNGFKTNFVEPEQHSYAAVIDEAPDEKLTAKALEDIHNTERLSGFGRFAAKMQNLFQASKSSQTKRESSHLKAAPIMMSAGLLLLVATGLLFLLSKPESAVHSHFRQPTGLSGADDHRVANGPNAESPVTESQLAGADTNADTQAMNRVRAAGRARQDAAAHRLSLPPGEGGASSASFAPNQGSATTELQAPATVFVANSVPISIVSPVSNFESRQSDVQVPSGTEITAHTTNAISSGLESPVIAIVDRNLQFGDKVVIPQGARVIGYTAGAVKDRINVRFTSLILPNNREVTISALALMKDGSAGLAGKVQGSGHPILAGAGRVATGASVLAIQFAGQNSSTLSQPFSQGDYLRNQLASEVASEGSHYSSRLQQPTSVPIVTVNTNQSIRVFLLTALSVSNGSVRNSKPAQQTDTGATLTAEQNQAPDQALAAAQTAYIQALEAQLADMRAALNGGRTNGRR